MNKKQYSILLVIYCLTLFLGGFYFYNFRIDSDILKTLNQKMYNAELTEAHSRYEKNIAKEVLVVVNSKESVLKLISDLEKKNVFDSITFKINPSKSKEMYNYYFKHRRSILDIKDIEAVENNDINKIEKSALQKLYNPFNSFSGLFSKDPYLLFQDSFRQVEVGNRFDIDEGFIRLKRGEEDTYLVSGQLNKVDEAESVLRLIQESENVLGYLSLSFYGVKAKKQALYESNLFLSISMVLILIAFYYFFNTARHVLVSVGLISLSCMVALYGTTLISGKVHVITLLLGVSVLGIIADYFIHYFMEETDSFVSNGIEAIRKIRMPIAFSFVTSAIGFGVFAFVPLGVLRQFSIFSLISLIVAFLLVRRVLPIFFVKGKTCEKESLNEKLYILQGEKTFSKYILGGLTLLAVVPILYCDVGNDVRAFSDRDNELLKNEVMIKEMLNIDSSLNQFVVFGETFQDALENEEELKKRFVENGLVGSFFSDWFPSLRMQNRSLKAYDKLEANLSNFLEKIGGLNTSQIMNNIQSATKDPVADDKFINPKIAKQNVGKIGGNYFLIVPVLSNENKVNLSNISSSSFKHLNKLGLINDSLNSFSVLIVNGILLFYLVAFIILLLRFGISGAILILRPTAISATITIGIASIMYDSLNLFHILGVVIVIALGLDSSFFYYFNRKISKSVGRAVTLSTITTLSSFGVLSTSNTNAISSFGTIVLVGMTFCWFLVPSSAQKELNV